MDMRFVIPLLLFFQSSVVFAMEPIKVIQLEGTATETVGDSIYRLKVGSLLHADSQIKIDDHSMLIMILGRDVVTKLGPNSRATVYSRNKKDWELNLYRGITASAVRNPEQRPNHFQVRNRSVVMGVRGTVFYTENLENKPIFLCACKGTVAVENDKGKQLDSIKATHHDRPITISEIANSKDPVIRTAPMGNGHSDADVAYLEKLLYAN